jgi:hypothetical protein
MAKQFISKRSGDNKLAIKELKALYSNFLRPAQAGANLATVSSFGQVRAAPIVQNEEVMDLEVVLEEPINMAQSLEQMVLDVMQAVAEDVILFFKSDPHCSFVRHPKGPKDRLPNFSQHYLDQQSPLCIYDSSFWSYFMEIKPCKPSKAFNSLLKVLTHVLFKSKRWRKSNAVLGLALRAKKLGLVPSHPSIVSALAAQIRQLQVTKQAFPCVISEQDVLKRKTYWVFE